MGVRKIDYSLCTSCGTCVDVCPLDVFRMHKEKEIPYIAYLSDCMSCFHCELECPAEAIYCIPDREMRMPRPF